MAKKLLLFEFINWDSQKNIHSFVSDLAKDIKNLLQEDIDRVNRIDIDAYAPEGVRAKLRQDSLNSIDAVNNILSVTFKPTEQLNKELKHLEDLLYILSQFKSEQEICVQLKEAIQRAKQIYPNPDKLFNQQATSTSGILGANQIVPMQPETPISPAELQ